MILAVMNAVYAIAYIEAWKSQDFNRVWTREHAISVQHSNQLRYEATDVGSWLFVGPKEPVRNDCEVIISNISYIELRMWNQVSYDLRRYERNLCNCIYKSLQKVRTSTGFEPVTSRYWCDNLPNWAMKPLTLGGGHLWVLGSLWGMNVKVIYEIFHTLNCRCEIK